jgi:hypothetical protein
MQVGHGHQTQGIFKVAEESAGADMAILPLGHFADSVGYWNSPRKLVSCQGALKPLA